MTKLGFHPPLTRLYVFVKNEANCLWYWLDDGRKQYIQETALTGILKRIEVKESQTSHGSGLKADFEMIADRRYVLRSGIDSAFTRGMLMMIAALSDEQLRHPITIELKPGDEKGNVLMSARDPETFEPIITGKWEGADWEALLNQALARLGEIPKPKATQPATPTTESTISHKQYEDLYARAKQSGYSNAGFAKLLAKFGFSRGSEVTQNAYQQLWTEAGVRNQAALMNVRAE